MELLPALSLGAFIAELRVGPFEFCFMERLHALSLGAFIAELRVGPFEFCFMELLHALSLGAFIAELRVVHVFAYLCECAHRCRVTLFETTFLRHWI